MSGRRHWRGIDNEPGWINRRFRDLEAQVKQLRSERRLSSSSVAGGVITVQEILTNPDAGVEFLNTDTATALGPVPTGDLVITLSQVPKAGSEQVFIAGLPIPRSAWTRTDHQLTIPGQLWFWTGMLAWVDYAYIGTSSLLGPVITPPGATTDTTPTISGTGAGGRSLQVWVDGTSVGTTTVAADGTWSVTVGSPIALGAHTVAARQTEPDGTLLTATPVTFYVVTLPLTSLTLRDVDDTGALPAGTHLNDFLVVVSRGPDYSGDSRLTLVSTNPPMETKTWIGNATSLAALSHTGTGAAKVAAFVGSATKLASSHAEGGIAGSSPVASPVPGSAAVLALGERSSYVSGTWGPPAPWVHAPSGPPPYSDGGIHYGAVDIFYWSDAAATDSPAGAVNAGGGIDEVDVIVLTLQAP